MWILNDHEQIATLRVVYICLAFLFISLVIFAFNNVFRYLIKLEQVRCWMICAFYVLVIVQAFAHIIVFIILSVKPACSPFYYDDSGNSCHAVRVWI